MSTRNTFNCNSAESNTGSFITVQSYSSILPNKQFRMDEIHHLIFDRNARETIPFQAIYSSYAALQNRVNHLQLQCRSLEHENDAQTEWIRNQKDGRGSTKLEIKLREKVENLQEQLNQKLRSELETSTNLLKMTTELAKIKDCAITQETTISCLREEIIQQKDMIRRLTEETEEAKKYSRFAEMQYEGLKETIRNLQEENDEFRKSNESLVGRLVTEKEKWIEQMNQMTELMDTQMKELEMLRLYKDQEDQRQYWKGSIPGLSGNSSKDESDFVAQRRFGSDGVIVPSAPKFTIRAHPSQATSIRYDSSGSDLVATAGEDFTIKLWDTSHGQVKGTMRGGGSGNIMLGVDLVGGITVGCGSDKMCRVWNTRTERMMHQLVGHSLKVTCVRIYDGEKTVVTGSADRSIKVWDIARSTYKQTISLRHSSTANGIDVWSTSMTAASGHIDGALRFWDLRTSDRTIELLDLHIGGVTSVQFNPGNTVEVLTLGRDSQIKLLDVRNRSVVRTFQNQKFHVDVNYASAAISPDGKYALAGSSSTGDLFVWSTVTGELVAQLNGHGSGVVGVAWGRGGLNGQQVASIDKSGNLILWA